MLRTRSAALPLRTAARLLALVSPALLAACAHYRGEVVEPDVSLVNLVPIEMSAFEARFRVDLRIANPNDFELALDGLSFDFELNGQPFARGLSDARVTVPRLGDAVVSATATTTLVDLLRQLARVTESPDPPPFDYRLSGRLFVERPVSRAFPFDRSGQLAP